MTGSFNLLINYSSAFEFNTAKFTDPFKKRNAKRKKAFGFYTLLTF